MNNTTDPIEEIKKCYHCEASIVNGDLTIIEGNLYCEACKNELTQECYNCENTFLLSNCLEFNSNQYCEECHDELVGYCNECKESVLSEDLTCINDEWMCDSCKDNNYFSCDSCSEWKHNDDSVSVYNGDNVCENCYSNSYYTCYTCDNVYHEDDRYYCEDCGNDFCNDCYSASAHDCNDGSRIDNSIQFLEGKKCPGMPFKTFVGVEIEHIAPHSINFRDIEEVANVGEDGSIKTDDENGYRYEVRTMPASGDKLIEVITKTTELLKQNEAKVNKTCGLHIHIDCRSIYNSPILLSRLFKLYYAFEDCLYLMLPSTRVNNHFCMPLSNSYEKPISATNRSRLLEQWRGRNIYHGQEKGSRYHAFNMEALSAHHTIELRLHSGTVDKVKILNWIKINLYIFEYMHAFNPKTISDISKMPLSKKKIDLFFKTVKLPQELQDYYWSRVKKFNPTLKLRKYPVKIKFEAIALQKEIGKAQEIINRKIRVLASKDGNNHSDNYYYSHRGIMPLLKQLEKLQRSEKRVKTRLCKTENNQVLPDIF